MSSLSSAAPQVRATRLPLPSLHHGDEMLAHQTARGSERAFATLYERYHQPLYRYCRSILRNDADAQDALQSTFAGALQALKRDQRNAPLRPWLYRIAHNESISLLRRRSRDAAEELDPEQLGVGSSVEQQATARARFQALMVDLGRLPDRQRGALLLRELNGLSHEEIGTALGTSTAAAKQAIFEARQALSELEEGRSMSCEETRRRLSEGDRRVLRGRRVNAHLRACLACEAFALAIPARRAQLQAMTPTLPAASAAALLARALHAGSGVNGSGGASAATAGVGGAGKAAGTAMAWKTIAGVALIAATAAGGVSGVRHLFAGRHATADPAPALRTATPLGAAREKAVTAGGRDSKRAHSASADRGALSRSQSPRVTAAANAGSAHPAAVSGAGAGTRSGSTQPADSPVRTTTASRGSHPVATGRGVSGAVSGAASGAVSQVTTTVSKVTGSLPSGTVTVPSVTVAAPPVKVPLPTGTVTVPTVTTPSVTVTVPRVTLGLPK